MQKGIRSIVLKRRAHKESRDLYKRILPIMGLLSLIWFLIRVIPKPSRASYPCMQAAFPFASAFIAWLISLTGSILLFKKARVLFKVTRYGWALLIFGFAVMVQFLAGAIFPDLTALASAIQNKAGLLSNASYTFPDPESNLIIPLTTVAIVQSGKAEVSEIQSAEIEMMVREAVELAGGLGELISDGDTVVLKPNLVADHIQTGNFESLYPGSNGVDTDYRVIQAVVNIVRELNPTGKIILMEGAGMGTSSHTFTVVGWDLITGLDQVVFLEDICAWQEKDSPALVRLKLPDDKFLYQAHDNTYYMSKLYYNADVLISIPCLKNHLSAGVSGGVKNVGIGATPSQIYGLGPENENPYGRWGADNGIDHTWTALNNWIHDFYMLRPVDFVIMDGLQGIQFGPGPHRGVDLESNQMNMRLILAGKDAIAVDAIEALAMWHDPEKVPYLTLLHEDKIGCADARYIKVSGKQIDDVKKQFGTAENGVMVQQYDNTAPEPLVSDYFIEADQLHFSLSGDETVSKVEVLINDRMLEENIIGGFDDVSIGLPDVLSNDDQIWLVVYDKYLNHQKTELIKKTSSVDRVEWESIHVYPLPSSTYFNLSINSQVMGLIRIKLTDSKGAIQKSFTFMKDAPELIREIYVADMPAGTYILTIEGSDYQSARKIIVKR